jgi:protein involved in polysaccharide export with SLBB domain
VASDVPSSDAVPLVTQRILEIPTKQLLAGVAEYNIVIRPGDLISVPPPEQGFFYISGPGSLRGGSFVLPSVGRMTLKQAIASSGGLGPIAIPERVDLIRRIGRDREGMVRLNLRAIYEGTQPDIFLKPEDQVVIGTNFWATPIAVVRNGFRVSYGWGFLLDRNFGNDVFGAPPSNIN